MTFGNPAHFCTVDKMLGVVLKAGWILCGYVFTSPVEGAEFLIQRAPLAGSQYHALDRLWSRIQAGDTLTLTREPNHPHDRHAIRVDWRGHQIGYLPRKSNQVAAQILDSGESLSARISRLRLHPDPWQRLEIEVFLKL